MHVGASRLPPLLHSVDVEWRDRAALPPVRQHRRALRLPGRLRVLRAPLPDRDRVGGRRRGSVSLMPVVDCCEVRTPRFDVSSLRAYAVSACRLESRPSISASTGTRMPMTRSSTFAKASDTVKEKANTTAQASA